jgi:hypothetical protein
MHKRLVVFSDLLQHSQSLSLYTEVPRAEDFTRTEAYRKLRADLRDVDVEIFLIRRETKKRIQSPELIRFWEELIAAEGGRVSRYKPIEG